MAISRPAKLRVYLDANVIYRGATNSTMYTSSMVLLALSENTFIDAITCTLGVDECERNLRDNAPSALSKFRDLVDLAVDVVPEPTRAELDPYRELADQKDVPHLVSALKEDCRYLATFNRKDFEPGHPKVTVMEPGTLVQLLRRHIYRL